MNKKSLIIKHKDDTLCISGSKSEITSFIKWVKNYNRGTYIKNSIVCNTTNDMKACRLKALHQKLNIV